MTPKAPSQAQIPTPDEQARQRLQMDLSPAVASLLDHVVFVTGGTRSSVVLQALLDALPALVERADSIKKRHVEITKPPTGKR
jgi:uncharacterized protein YgbK (DUF1537 family)